ncbi:sodium:solute symporter [Sphingomonas sp. BAUL-RG-20F-R05-02]|uniref:sodium:solute symporter n=1 Tax=Sphingomonas sp. BAUL-RG-20F-R05-02 TaxID=2914830 RepID=UPI001F56F56D|nr:sodium:solute symporter [Sphingomonas sp. BAUL-RG-20F-R05-02]
MRASWLRAVVVALSLIFLVTPALASQPTSTVVTPLSPIGGGDPAPVLATIDGHTIALGKQARTLGTDGAWRPIDMRALGAPIERAGLVSDGHHAVALHTVDGVTRSVAEVTWSVAALQPRTLPPLPIMLRSATAGVASDGVLVAGLAPDGSPRLFRLAWTGASDWQAIPAWPGKAAPASVASQNSGIFITLTGGDQWRWQRTTGWRKGARAPGTIVAGSGRAVGQAYLLYLLHDAAGTRLYSYSAITDAWAPLGRPLVGTPVAAAPFHDGILWASAEGNVASVALKVDRRSLDWLDWTIIGGYLFAMLGIGLYFYRLAKRGPSSEFFLGSRTIPFWAAGISMFAGSISSISYLAIPAKAFETDWEYIMSKITTVFALMFVAIFVVPLFRRLNLVSVFNYLEMRFHPVIRMLSSALWILMQVGGRMGIVLFLPAMAIGTITDTSVTACILVVGLFTIVYTALGGMRAVVWTDVFQVLVLTCGAVFAIGFIIYSIGFGTIADTTTAFDKTRMLNTSFDITQPTIWGFLVLALFDVVLTFPKDQVLMQRVLATSSEKQASRSIWLFAIVLLPSAFMFYIVGTMLFAYYHARPGQLNPMLPIDAVFPAFIGTELPHGVIGLIIAGLIAAAMGTLSGIINSVATLLSVDFYDRFVPDRSERQIVRFAEVASVGVGLVGIAIAIILSRLDIHSLLDLTIELFGLLGGSCAGAYTLGMFTRRANWQGVAIGIVVASAITLVVWLYGLIHPYLYLALAIATSIGIGYLASWFFPRPMQSLDGLTIFGGGTHVEEGPRSIPAS